MNNKDYIPTVETRFLIWSENYVNVLASNASRWSIPDSAVSRLHGLNTEYKEKYSVAENPATRTRVAIQAKNDAKKAFIAGIRRVYRSYVLYNESVSNEDRELLQVSIHDTKATPSVAPHTAPLGRGRYLRASATYYKGGRFGRSTQTRRTARRCSRI